MRVMISWASGPQCYKKASWMVQKEQATEQCSSKSTASIPVSTLLSDDI